MHCWTANVPHSSERIISIILTVIGLGSWAQRSCARWYLIIKWIFLNENKNCLREKFDSFLKPKKHKSPLDIQWISLWYHVSKRWPMDVYRISCATWEVLRKYWIISVVINHQGPLHCLEVFKPVACMNSNCHYLRYSSSLSQRCLYCITWQRTAGGR